MRVLKWIGYIALALIAASIPAYWWLFMQSHVPSAGRYSLDIATIRRLGDSIAGDRPEEIRVETVAHFSPPQAIVVAGDGWQSADLPVSAYEVVYPHDRIIIDTAFDAVVAQQMEAGSFDSTAFEHVSNALAMAGLIIITHEHPDHAAGLLSQPNLKSLLGSTRLTDVQVAELKKAFPKPPLAKLKLNAAIFNDYRPVAYERYQAVAPGVVLIKAPGHTPGSQMVYVRLADGREILFLGDVAWEMRNVDTVRERARLVTWLTGEDRDAVLRELAELNRLHHAEPHLNMMPGHDPGVLASFLQAGLLTKGF
ncbi:MAG TPA: MBL fold metallo-hydrolase [Steroidobacteraceae bacterium]|nr:MBL fold metallo-hydrolase [Steroidobacteraceae bacterium]